MSESVIFSWFFNGLIGGAMVELIKLSKGRDLAIVDGGYVMDNFGLLRVRKKNSAWTFLMAFGLFLLGVYSFAVADGGPDYYAVTGIAANGLLNIRAEPSVKSKRIGTIPAGARGLQNLGCTGTPSLAEWEKMTERERKLAGKRRWCKVRYRGVEGWVAGRFLMEDSSPQAGSGQAQQGVGATQ